MDEHWIGFLGTQYDQGEYGWDVRLYFQHHLKEYIDHIPIRNLKILIPGAGNFLWATTANQLSFEKDWLFPNAFMSLTLAKQATGS